MSWEDVFGLDGQVVKGTEGGMGVKMGDIEKSRAGRGSRMPDFDSLMKT